MFTFLSQLFIYVIQLFYYIHKRIKQIKKIEGKRISNSLSACKTIQFLCNYLVIQNFITKNNMQPVSYLVKEALPNYLSNLPIPNSVGGWFRLSCK